MGHAQKKDERLYIPSRDTSRVARPRPALGEGVSHHEQVKNAFDVGFARYEKAMEDLAKV